MKRVLLIGAICVAAAGCNAGSTSPTANAPSPRDAAKEAFAQEQRNCAAKGFKTHVEQVKCVNEAENRLLGPFIAANRDLLDAKQAKYMSVAERIDQGKVTEAEGMLEFQQAMGELSSEAARRANSSKPPAGQDPAATNLIR